MELSIKRIANNLILLIVKPGEFWSDLKSDKTGKNSLFVVYFLPLLSVVALAVFFGELLKSHTLYIGFALLKSLREIVLLSGYYFLSVYFANELMEMSGGKKNKSVAQKLVIFSMTPYLLVSIITGLFPFLYIMDVLVLYSFYIFWLGAEELVELPGKNLKKYILINILIGFIIFSFLSILLSKILTLYI